MERTGTALVTGASRGIGRAVAAELARRGWDTVATMRKAADGAELEAEAAREVWHLRVARLDVTDPSTVDIPAGIRVLVNNAGVETENLPIEHGDVDEHWRYLFEANVFGLVRVTQRAIPLLRANGGGVIVNVTSSSILAPVPFLGMYRSSKAAVAAMSESLAAEVARFGIRVVDVLPGPIVTDMLRNSEKPAEAIRYDEYRALAESMWEMRRQTIEHYTPAEEAARRIVDAIEGAEAPLTRVACDDLAQGMLDAWKSQSHDTMMSSIMQWYAGG